MLRKVTTLCLFICSVSGGKISRQNLSANNGAASNQTREPTVDDINFYLWTRKTGPDNYAQVDFNIDSLIQNGFHADNPTIIVSHGFSSNGAGFTQAFANAYLSVGDFNVISIDWEKLAMWYDYFGAAKRTKVVAEHAANLVQVIANHGGFSQLHLVGHSLGAHVVGFIGKKIQELGLGKVPRITGLDPALPAFELAGQDGRIDKTDAEFVDIIHSNSGMLWEGCLSNWKELGHYDFYPAGGKHQPGCTDLCVATVCDENNIIDLIKGGCSHSRATEYFIESIQLSSTTTFMSWQCESWEAFELGQCCQNQFAHMGLHLDRYSPEGSYYLMVKEEAPFSLGENGNFC